MTCFPSLLSFLSPFGRRNRIHIVLYALKDNFAKHIDARSYCLVATGSSMMSSRMYIVTVEY